MGIRAAVPDADGGRTDEASELQLPRRAEKGICAPSILHLSPFVFLDKIHLTRSIGWMEVICCGFLDVI